ncbi:MAG: HAD family hydrolase [Aristaeellaceae bacterium]
MRIRAAVFDLDGTLTNTLNDIATAMNRSLRLHGLAEFPVDAYRYLVGDGAKMLATRAVRDRLDLAESVRREYQAYYQEHTLDTTRPYPGIPELLRALTAQGIQVCVLSNKPHADTCGVVRHFFPEIPFAQIRGQVEGVPVKPDPAGALMIARALSLSPEEFVYLGDTNVDMRTARNAGMHPVGVTWGFRTAEELTEAGAERLIANPTDLLQFVTVL